MVKSPISPLKTPKTPKRKSLTGNKVSTLVKRKSVRLANTPSSVKRQKRISTINLLDSPDDFKVEIIGKSPKNANESIVSNAGKENSFLVKNKKKSANEGSFVFTSSKIIDLEVERTPKTGKKSKNVEETPTIKNKRKSKIIDLIKVETTPKNLQKTPKTDGSSKPTPGKKTNKENVRNKPDLDKLESKYNVKVSDVKQAIEGVIKFVRENPKLQNQLFNEQIPLLMQITCLKVPKGHPKIFRIPLSHSALTAEDDICLIVPDVKGIKNDEHEQHQQYYEELLAKKGVSGIKKIMTFHEFRTEYETFELKNRLADLYDLFLADGRISGKVVQKSGKVFYKKRKVPTPVKLYASNLKKHIEDAKNKAYFYVHLKSDNYCLQFGHDKMDIDGLVENVFDVIQFLDKHFPGGFENIRNIQIKSQRSTSVPIYISLKGLEAASLPQLKNKKPKAFNTVKGELSTALGTTVSVNPYGKVIVKKIKEEIVDPTIAAVEKIQEENGTKEIGKKRKQVEDGRNKETKVKKMSKGNKNVNIVRKVKPKKK